MVKDLTTHFTEEKNQMSDKHKNSFITVIQEENEN